MEEFIAVMITAGNDEEAGNIARALVDEKLVACANLYPVSSVYRWKGETYEEVEVMLMCKTVKANLERLKARVKEMHSYDVPEIVALPIIDGNRDYLEWVEENTATEH